MTIVDAIKQVMREAGKPLTAKEAYTLICAKDLYQFKAKNPQSIVAGQIRKHCKGIDLPKAPATKHFEQVEKRLFKPL
ncbi:MAG: HTH domain-containing protein [Pseudomonadales bacterium]